VQDVKSVVFYSFLSKRWWIKSRNQVILNYCNVHKITTERIIQPHAVDVNKREIQERRA
jgi:predicted DNA-binding transcriptional regulator YafY